MVDRTLRDTINLYKARLQEVRECFDKGVARAIALEQELAELDAMLRQWAEEEKVIMSKCGVVPPACG